MQQPSGQQPRVQIFTRPGCHLCEVAVAMVDEVCAELGVDWAEIDINDDPDLLDRYTDMVPVTVIDGEQHDYWRVDPARLRTALAGP